MTWLHVYTEGGQTAAPHSPLVAEAPGYGSSIDLFGFEVELWMPVAIAVSLAVILVLQAYDIASFQRWKTDAMALLIAASILLPLWPCYRGIAYPGLGWYCGALCAILALSEYLSKHRNYFQKKMVRMNKPMDRSA